MATTTQGVAVHASNGHWAAEEELDAAYRAGYEAGHASGRESGYRQGFEEGYAAAHKGPNGAAVTSAAEAAPAPKRGPRRMLLSLSCANCGAYFPSDETHCSACKLPQRHTPAQPE
jgi:hypothetical protein